MKLLLKNYIHNNGGDKSYGGCYKKNVDRNPDDWSDSGDDVIFRAYPDNRSTRLSIR